MCRAAVLRKASTCIPDFERAIRAARDNLATVLVKIDAEHVAIVGVGLLALELQRGCVGRQEVSVLEQEGRFGAVSHLNPRL